MHRRLLAASLVAALTSSVSCAHESQTQLAMSKAGSGTSSPSTPSSTGATGASTASRAQKPRYVIADAHMHFVDFLQQTDGLQVILKAMDEAGVDHSMINGMSLVKKWDATRPIKPTYYLNDDSRTYWYSLTDEIVARALLQLPEKDRQRFHPFITGVNPTDRNAVDHVQRMLEWHPDLWEGIGELFGHHDDLSALTYDETARPNHVALDPVYALAAEKDLPVTLHTNITSVGLPNTTIFLDEVAEAVSRHPNTRFIWCHAGISRRIQMTNYPATVAAFMEAHPNVWVDLSWVVYPDYVAPGGKPDPAWVALVERFPTRFMIGSDTVGHFQNHVATIQQYYPLLDALKPETARRVARDNFLSILPARVRARIQPLTAPASASHTP
jgi:predicted TIM-barrel fold metal-dependent hydrolase